TSARPSISGRWRPTTANVRAMMRPISTRGAPASMTVTSTSVCGGCDVCGRGAQWGSAGERHGTWRTIRGEWDRAPPGAHAGRRPALLITHAQSYGSWVPGIASRSRNDGVGRYDIARTHRAARRSSFSSMRFTVSLIVLDRLVLDGNARSVERVANI